MARVVQAALVREGNVAVSGFTAYARMTPAQQVGGDFVDVFKPSERELFFCVCDVSGKGVAAALFMAASQGAINAAVTKKQNVDIGAIATEANRQLCSENPMGLFVTGVLAVLDLDQGVMEYVCAGHDPPFLVDAGGSRRALPITHGIPMGVIDEFEYGSHREGLVPGDSLFMYTDGLTDAVNLSDELFGKERLESTLDGASTCSPEEIVGHVWSEIGAYSAGAPAADDMTCLVLRRSM